jgi:hypothetical protein
MAVYYFTLAPSQGGSGYVEVHACDSNAARAKMFDKYGDRWAFQYTSFMMLHDLDKTLLDVIM